MPNLLLLAESLDLLETETAGPNVLDAFLSRALTKSSDAMAELSRGAIRRLLGYGSSGLGDQRLFTEDEMRRMADIFASAIGTADLLGRSVIRDQKHAAEARHGSVEESIQIPARTQQQSYACGVAALRAVLAYYGIDVDEKTLGLQLGTTPEKGTTPDAIVRVAKAYRLPVSESQCITLKTLPVYQELGLPVIAAVTMYGGGHYVVITGCEDDRVYFMDPAQGAGNRVMRWEEFRDIWHSTDWKGNRYTQYGIAIGKTETKESRLTEELTAPEKPLTPEAALEYFLTLVPTLGIDPQQWGERLRRHAFTLAYASNVEMLETVQGIIRDLLQTGQGISLAPTKIGEVFLRSGVQVANPQYAEAVMRTQMMQSYVNGYQKELQDPDVAEVFPVWRWDAIVDSRSRPEHAARNGNYYPVSLPFTTVRGHQASEVINCRCVPTAVSKWEWSDLQARGKRVSA